MQSKIRQHIISRINRLPEQKLEDLMTYIDKIDAPKLPSHQILNFAGAWKDLDEVTLDEFTTNLHQRRNKSLRQ